MKKSPKRTLTPLDATPRKRTLPPLDDKKASSLPPLKRTTDLPKVTPGDGA